MEYNGKMTKCAEDSKELSETELRVEEDHKKCLPYIATVATGTLFWGYIVSKRVNRMLINRYGNLVYQIRRAESIGNRYTAFKYLTIGGLIVPTVVLSSVYVASRKQGEGKDNITTFKGESAIALSKATSQNIYRYTNNASRRLEGITDVIKGKIMPEGIPRMADDLRNDINALKRWLKNIF